ncbi:hypothetical protein BJY04DRAFT_219031 [Aspergillus karnatakaensis]|uniref:uncharacterized protein n=1 Tax=Aspergillus karnatakaensis TaxID=1810916 RepID=UPI003CCD87B7
MTQNIPDEEKVYPPADVLWWDAKFYYVLCPHCEQTHRHSMKRAGSKTRKPRCGVSERYRCHFPMTVEGDVAYENNKKQARYINICLLEYATTQAEMLPLVEDLVRKVNLREAPQESGHSDPSISEDAVKGTTTRDPDGERIIRLHSGKSKTSRTLFGRTLTIQDAQYCFFRRSPTDSCTLLLQGLTQSQTYTMTESSKTIARLERGGMFPPVSAMSGWADSPIGSLRLDNGAWTKEVFHISEVVGHYLPPHDRDQDEPRGHYYACHAEKQLIAYFLDRHVFLPRDQEPNPEFEERIKAVEDSREYEQLVSLQHEKEQLRVASPKHET